MQQGQSCRADWWCHAVPTDGIDPWMNRYIPVFQKNVQKIQKFFLGFFPNLLVYKLYLDKNKVILRHKWIELLGYRKFWIFSFRSIEEQLYWTGLAASVASIEGNCFCCSWISWLGILINFNYKQECEKEWEKE